MTKKKEYQFLHSTYWRSKSGNADAVIATIKDVHSGEVELKTFQNPKRTIYVTRPALREQQTSKKLCEDMDNLDAYHIENCKLREELQKAVTGRVGGYANQKSLMNSPYVYGADVDISVLIKQHYMNQTDNVCKEFRVGGLDIENAVPGVLGGKEITHITYVSPELKVYTAVLNAFIKDFGEDEVMSSCHKQISEFSSKLNKQGKNIYDKYTIELNIKRFQTEVEMIKWIFDIIHIDKPEFISVWNMDYDIPFILDRLDKFGANKWAIMCHPDVPKSFRVCNYRKDNNKKVQHFTHSWHMFNLSGYSQFYDSMSLLSRLRKHKGVMDSYRLDFITKKFLGVGKLEHDNENHYKMQSTRQVDYTAYNIVDSLLLVLLEKRVKDIPSLLMLVKNTSIDSFAQQTVQLKNWFYNYLKDMNKVPTSWQGRVLHPTDELIANVGGNVLAPSRAWRTGVTRIKELIGVVKDVSAKMTLLTSDLDVALIYGAS